MSTARGADACRGVLEKLYELRDVKGSRGGGWRGVRCGAGRQGVGQVVDWGK